VASPAHAAHVKRLRAALDTHTRTVRDVGFLPEYELQREGAASPYERGHDPKQYDFESVYKAAQHASDRTVGIEQIRPGLSDPNPVVRYWSAMGTVVRGREAVSAVRGDLERLLADPEPGPRLQAAEALGRFGTPEDRKRAIDVLLQAAQGPVFVAQLALYTLNQFERLPQEVLDAVAAVPPAAGRGGRGGRGGGDGEEGAGRGRGAGGGGERGAQAAATEGRQGGAGGAGARGGRGGFGGGGGQNRGDQRANLKAAIAQDVR
jgi:hypothetical protein